MAVVASGEMAVTPDLKGFEQKMSSSLGGLAKKAALAFGGAFAATKAVSFLGDAIGAARESNAVAAQTAAAIKSTGGAANVTAKQVDELSNSIARKTGIDDEQIAKASNLLLTFTQVQNRVGQGNDIFNQATKIAVDMGKALGTDASGSAIQLGKALNDPIKGITALTRVGVTFSDAQKKQIQQFVETGRVADAQKVILAELSKEFGGSAEAQATASDKLKVTLGNLQESLGNTLVPIVDKVAGLLADKLPGALSAAGNAFDTVKSAVAPVIRTISLGIRALGLAFDGNGRTSDGFVGKMERLGIVIRTAYDGAVKPLAQFLASKFKPTLEAVGKVADSAFTVFLNVTEFLQRNATAVKAVAAVIAAVLIPHYVALGVAATVSAATQVAAWIATKVQAIAAAVVHSAQVVLMIAKWVAMGIAATANAAVVAAAWLVSIGPIAAVVAAVVGATVLIVKNWDTIRDAIVTAAKFVIDFLKNNWPLILGILTGPIGLAVALIIKHWETIKSAAAGVFTFVSGQFTSLVGFISGLPGKIGAAAAGMFDGIKNAFKSAINWIISKWNHIEFKLPSVDTHIPGVGKIGGFTLGTPNIPLLAQGALTQGTAFFAGDNRSGREAVIPLDSPRALSAIARAFTGATQPQASGVFRDLIIQGATFAGAERTATATVRELRAEAWRQGK